MKSAIEEIYFGNAGISDVPITDECRNLLHEVSGKQNEIMKTLSEKQKKLFIEISDLSNELEAETNLTNFKHGFELGLSLGMEIAMK